MRQALIADRHHDGDDWYITELISDEQIDLMLKKEMEGYPIVHQDPLGKLKQTYQLWNGTMDQAYTLSEHSQLRDALKAQRLFEDWYVTQVIVTSG